MFCSPISKLRAKLGLKPLEVGGSKSTSQEPGQLGGDAEAQGEATGKLLVNQTLKQRWLDTCTSSHVQGLPESLQQARTYKSRSGQEC